MLRKEDDAKMGNNYRFSDYLMETFGDAAQQDEEKKRKELYRLLKKELSAYNIVSNATLKLWCGIGGNRKPSREKLLQMAVVMLWSEDQLQQAFSRGMQEPGVQINDYQEVIYFYGLQHGLALEECEAMIHVFEREVHRDLVLEQKTHTEELWEAYKDWTKLDKEHFLFVMCENAGKFKGYSKTALNYFVKYRNEILRYVRQDARNQLMDILGDTNFFVWARKEGVKTINYDVQIRRFLKNEKRRKNTGLTKDQIHDIEYYHWLGYSKENRNTDLIMELYVGALDEPAQKQGKSRKISFLDRSLFRAPQEVKFMSNTYLSHLLNVSVQKERDIRLSMLSSRLMDLKDDMPCPDWAMRELKAFVREAPVMTCGEAKKLLSKEKVSQRKKCVLVERGDLLALIHCLSQKRYMEGCQEHTREYDCEGAKKAFVDMADATLTACNMPTIHEEYALDHFLLSAFGKEEMMSYSEMIEQTAWE